LFDYLLRVVVPDVATDERFLKEWLARAVTRRRPRPSASPRHRRWHAFD